MDIVWIIIFSLAVYDLGEKKDLYTKWLSDSDSKLLVPTNAGLFHMGNVKFCLAWPFLMVLLNT